MVVLISVSSGRPIRTPVLVEHMLDITADEFNIISNGAELHRMRNVNVVEGVDSK